MAGDGRRSRGRLTAIGASTVLAILAACAGGENIVVVPPDSIAGDGGFISVRNDGGTCQQQCSLDLHRRVCGEEVVETCPPDQGCGRVGCVSPCAAAVDNQSATGCEYYALRLPTKHGGYVNEGDCFAVAVVNTWTTPVTLSVERAGRTYDTASLARIPSGQGRDMTYASLPDGKLPPGQVAVLFLAHNQGGTSRALCPVTPAIANAEIDTITDRGEAFRIGASAPVVAYDYLPWGASYATQLSASLLLPTSLWGFEYLAVDGYKHGKVTELLPVRPGDGITAIVARENDTELTVRPSSQAYIDSSLVTAGSAKTVRLKRGELLQIRADFSPLAGSLITANKPVGVWGGSDGLVVDEYQQCNPHAVHQQLPPVRALGNEYVAARFRNRYDGVEESPPWRIVGAAPGTRLTYVPAAPKGAPETISTGDVIDFRSSGGFVVSSQDEAHPFYMAAYMEGSPGFNCSTPRPRGGPQFVNVIATGQYLTSYRFFTEPGFSETNLVVVRRRKDDAFRDVVLDCAGPLSGWTPISLPGQPASYEYTRVDLSRGAFEAQGQCRNGAHEMHSDAPFAVTVWGWGTEEAVGQPVRYPTSPPYNAGISYAFTAGMGARPLNIVALPPVVK